ncbi:hypothetical protein CHUAL_009866 [Chamberlinius hualienensis]
MKGFVLILLLGVVLATFIEEARLEKPDNFRRLVRREAQGSCRICTDGEADSEVGVVAQTGQSKEVCGNFCVTCPK